LVSSVANASGTLGTSITFFSIINNAISTSGRFALQTSGSGLEKSAVASTLRGTIISTVALFSGIEDTVSARRGITF